MILKMKKYTFLVYHKQYTDFLEKIRELGLLHIVERGKGTPDSDALMEKMQFAARIKNVIKQLGMYVPKETKIVERVAAEADVNILYKTETLLAEKDALELKYVSVEKERERMEVWGEFDFSRIEMLKNAGFELNFYSCALRNFNQEWETLYNAFEISTIGSTIYFVTVTLPGVKIEMDADSVRLGDATALQLENELIEIQTKITETKNAISQVAIEEISTLDALQVSNFEDIDYDKVVLNTETHADNRVMLLEGWCPEESEVQLNEYLEQSDVYYEVSVPTEDDKIPIKLKNNKFAKLFEPIGEMYDLPNYYELDLTPFFAPFYLLFFGLCLGDSAYGLLFLIIAIVLRIKAKPAMKPLLNLIIWLGSSTVVMGFISGTFLGFSLIDAKIEWLEKFKGIMLDSNKLFYTSLILGVIQIIYGIFVKAFGIVRRYGWAASLSTWGWLFLLVGVGGTYAVSEYGSLNADLAKYLYYGFGGIGLLLVFILNDIKRNPLINVGAGLWDTYNMATGLLGDTLSYVRLFALGICGSVMGFVFNDLAFKMSGDTPVVSTIIMLVIMLIGHGINIFMSTLGAFVHPMRLTFVEFYKNAGFEGGGKKFRPFARYQKNESFL
jgi:V/A-type H+/Na+-transporting ATPase subunit I